MKTLSPLQWFSVDLLCFLVGSLADSSSLPSSTLPQSITHKVGEQAVLPCSWKSRLGEVDLPSCHIQWKNPLKTVFEKRGESKYEAMAFKGRVEVPEERLGSGDCSLIIRDVQIMDTGRYESFMVVDGAWSSKRRVFIQSVRLLVSDHRDLRFHAPGEDFVLDLYTNHSQRVIFQARNSSEWTDLWMRGDKDSERLDKHPLMEQLTIRNLKYSDEGLYKVVDDHGLAISTMQLFVKEGSISYRKQQTQENQEPTDGAPKVSSSSLLLFSALVTILHILYFS
ncbi:galectin 17 [Cheilinus undulatus]|uniref:galectin 17 n=1 Tax=Cheilinus undulatus TaxID=241271 RepID=UPI001BD32B8B|nr:galectin 17 [Cheilinus undulatus]